MALEELELMPQSRGRKKEGCLILPDFFEKWDVKKFPAIKSSRSNVVSLFLNAYFKKPENSHAGILLALI